ncbi:hypothetical protein B0H17DRAFT_1182516 [Mycena rosella]|uniref:Uncharacterized protein n=1 Tax=Mycena rosella TaxID=1033263 RepID=A0AAD7GCT9_MYCRO|nr:hypothetical protein B0H17DRAFT_1182516 [Mycena rosella]
MNRQLSRPPRDMERPLQQGYPHPSVPPQARAGPQHQDSRPSMREPQPHPALQRQLSRPDQQYQEQQQPVLQRQRSRPDQPYQQQPPPPRLQQPHPSRPDQYSPEQSPLQSQPMADPYNYKALPVQPVQPAFVRAPSAPYSDSQSTLAAPTRPYAENMLIRGNSDDELDKSDVFWRRFNASAVHHQQLPDAEKNAWLEKHEGKSSKSRRNIWIASFIIILLAAGGIGIGIFLSFHNNSDNTRPTPIGGAADVTSGAAGAGATPVATGTLGAGAVATTSSLHVSPTNTVP